MQCSNVILGLKAKSFKRVVSITIRPKRLKVYLSNEPLMIRGLCRDDVTFAASVKLRHVTASRWPRSVLRFWWDRMHHTLMVISDEPDSMMSPVTSLPLSTVQRSWSESSDSEDEEPKLFRLVDCGLVVARWCWPPSRSGTYKQTTWPSWPRRMASHRPERCEIATIKSKQIWSIGQYG